MASRSSRPLFSSGSTIAIVLSARARLVSRYLMRSSRRSSTSSALADWMLAAPMRSRVPIAAHRKRSVRSNLRPAEEAVLAGTLPERTAMTYEPPEPAADPIRLPRANTLDRCHVLIRWHKKWSSTPHHHSSPHRHQRAPLLRPQTERTSISSPARNMLH